METAWLRWGDHLAFEKFIASEQRDRVWQDYVVMFRDILKSSPYPMNHDWVFASPTTKGKPPYWPDDLMKRHIKPGSRKAGINKNVGWHTFRHPFGTLLKANGEGVYTMQELLRHANSRIPLDVYTQAVTSPKRPHRAKL